MAHLSSNIFARLETLKKWQEEQQQRLVKQQSEQNEFLSNEQKRLNEALDNKIDETPVGRPKENLELVKSLDEEVICVKKDFKALLIEKLDETNENEISKTNMSKPKRPYLKKGTGLVRYRMTGQNFNPEVTSTSHKNTRRKLESENGTKNSNNSNKVQTTVNRNVQTNESQSNISIESVEIHGKATWRNVLQQTPNHSSTEPSLEQRAFEKQLEKELQIKKDLEELRIFELLEQKALNSSFCSTSSVITKLLGSYSPTKISTVPEKNLDITEKPENVFKDESTWETESQSSEIVSISTESETSIAELLCKDVFTNTEVPYPNTTPPNTDMLRTRLEQLEKEIETFREENNKVTKIKNDLTKEKKKFQKEIEDEKKQLEEERKKIGKEKQLLHDKYIREVRKN